MDKPLVTLASFSDSLRAQIAKNRLESAGIPAYLNGAEAAGAFAGLGSAVAAINLEVAEDDLERARDLLSRPADPVEEEEEDKQEQLDPNSTEAIAARAWKAAMLGWLICPPLLHLYSLWLILKLLSRDEEWSKSTTWQVYAAVAVDGCVLLAIGLFVGAIGLP